MLTYLNWQGPIFQLYSKLSLRVQGCVHFYFPVVTILSPFCQKMTDPTTTKFCQLDSANQHYSGERLSHDFTVPSKSQESQFQVHTNDPKEKCILFDYHNKEPKKQYTVPSIKDPLTDYTLSSLCQAILLAAEACGVNTFLCTPDSSGNILDMSIHNTHVSFQEVKTYIDHCLGPVPTPVLVASGTETPTSILAHAMTFDGSSM
jgi:hypothetical protein